MDSPPAPHEPGLEYGANAPDIVGDNIARQLADTRPRAVVVNEGGAQTPDMVRALQQLQRFESTPTVALIANNARPQRPAEYAMMRKVIATPITSTHPEAEDNVCLIGAGATMATAGAAVSRFRINIVYAHFRATYGDSGAEAAFLRHFPAGKAAFSLVKDSGRPTGQIAVQVHVDYADSFCDWLRQRRDGFLAIIVDGPRAFAYEHAIAVEKTVKGQVVHQGAVQETLFHQLGVQSAVIFNQREFPNCAIYAFSITRDALERVMELMDGDAAVDLLGERSLIFDYSPQSTRYRLYLAGAGGEALFEQDHVRQNFADALETNPNTMTISPVRDIPLKHGNVVCLEIDWSPTSYERILELTTQGFVRIAHPTKLHLNGTKVAVAQSIDDLQQMYGYNITRAIGSTATDGGNEVGAAPLRIAPQTLRLTAAYVSGATGPYPSWAAPPSTQPPGSQPPPSTLPPATTQGVVPSTAPPPAQASPAGVGELNASFRQFRLHQEQFRAWLATQPSNQEASAGVHTASDRSDMAGRQGIGMALLGIGRPDGTSPDGRRGVAGTGMDAPLVLPIAAPQVAGLGADPWGIGAAPPGGGMGAEFGAARQGIRVALLGGGLALGGAFVLGGDVGVDPSSLSMWWGAHRESFWDNTRGIHSYLGVTYASCSSRVRRKRRAWGDGASVLTRALVSDVAHVAPTVAATDCAVASVGAIADADGAAALADTLRTMYVGASRP
jgi:hypothetical protein